jgi:hypothetical protein
MRRSEYQHGCDSRRRRGGAALQRGPVAGHGLPGPVAGRYSGGPVAGHGLPGPVAGHGLPAPLI